MSQSEEETSGTESPFLKSRAVTRSESSSEEQESNQEESGDESEQQSDTDEEETEQPTAPTETIPKLAPKPSKAPRAPRPTTVKPKSYDIMLLEAMNALDENKKSGVSIRSVLKYVQDNMAMRENFKTYMFKKAIDKALSKDIFVHTSGTGMSGSIAFSAAQKKSKKIQQAKEIKAAEKQTKAEAKAKAKAKPKLKAAVKPKGPSKNKTNNPTEQPAESKIPTGKGKKARLSASLLPTLKAKAKPKPKAAAKPKTEAPKPSTNKETKKVVEEVAEPNTKGRAKPGPSKAAATKDKPVNSKK